ncbi:hypothetical protein AVEN_184780-1 [Araneus ventricosus]|uniref:Reverse transcriptase/retrotransposon-derived protein RNase H-like domain-containing protein n=1 Tax=Araneus ventricosus TaxID=182803 RepID=A0A4Y2PDU8_ARAVE|nr:hypothetical protein AVEN_184780-1 [Araneus ventricosus]
MQYVINGIPDSVIRKSILYGCQNLSEFKQILSKEPVLCLYNPKSETEIHTDASIDGFGACLLQKSIVDNQLHPVYYMSRKTSDTERKYSSYELEVMAVIEALKKFRPYVLGIPFKIVGHQPQQMALPSCVRSEDEAVENREKTTRRDERRWFWFLKTETRDETTRRFKRRYTMLMSAILII